MAHIKINYDMLTQQANSLGNQIEQYESLGTRANSLIGQIQSTWQGDACNAYVEMMQNYMLQAQKMVDVLTSFKSYAEDAANDFLETDRKCAASIRGSF